MPSAPDTHCRFEIFPLFLLLLLGMGGSPFQESLWAGEANAKDRSEKTVGVLWTSHSEMPRRVFEGFQAQIAKMAPSIAIEARPELPEDAAPAVYDEFQATKDAVIFLRSSGAVHIAKHPPRVPTFIGACNNPVALGVVPSLERPGGLVTGVTYAIPAKKQLRLWTLISPSIKAVGVLLERGHPSSAIDAQETKEACAEMGWSCQVAEVSEKEELLEHAKRFAENVDAILLGSQRLIHDYAPLVFDLLADPRTPRRIPIFSYSEKPIREGAAIAGLVADDEKLGRMLADSVIGVLKGGRFPGDIPIKVDPHPRFLLHVQAAKRLGVPIPETVLQSAIKVAP